MSTPIVDEVVEQLEHLPEDLQRRVLAYTRSLARSAPQGVSGQELLRFAGLIPADDLERMRQAVEQGCEQVDPDDW